MVRVREHICRTVYITYIYLINFITMLFSVSVCVVIFMQQCKHFEFKSFEIQEKLIKKFVVRNKQIRILL